MRIDAKIALSIPNPSREDRYFSFRVKQELRNESSEYRQSRKIFVVSDIEGNFRSFYKLLRKAKVVNKYMEWTFGDNRLVIVGDCFDRGEQVAECLWLIYSLEERARKNGGYVHFILGNHEIMNMNGDWRYVHPKYAEHTKSGKIHTALYDGNNELWRWLCTKNIIEKIGNYLFVHGGLAEDLLDADLPVTLINNIARPYYNRVGEASVDPIVSKLFNRADSPLWYRGYYDGTATEGQVDRALDKYGVKTIITGHTVVPEVNLYFNGKVVNVNTDHAAGISQGLLINNDKFYRVTMDGIKDRIEC